jgi:hypothetical protein
MEPWFVQKFCAWLWNNKTFNFCLAHHIIPEWIDMYVENVISRHAWRNGYQAAVTELRGNYCVMLEGILRMVACITSQFKPVRPVLLSYDSIFFDDWDAGYERAIMLWRLNCDPELLANVHHKLSEPLGSSYFEGLIRTVIDGDMKNDPRTYRNRKGLFLPIRHGYQTALDIVYYDYAEKYQQVKVAQLLLVQTECPDCAKSGSKCICERILNET